MTQDFDDATAQLHILSWLLGQISQTAYWQVWSSPKGCQPPWHQCFPPVFCIIWCHLCKYSLVSIMFSFRPDEATFDLTWRKLIYDLKSISVKASNELQINNWIQTECETNIYKVLLTFLQFLFSR